VEIGFDYMLAHMQRLKGFTEKTQESYPDIQILHVNKSKEDDKVVLEKTLSDLETYHDINGIYIASFGISGIVNAIKFKNLKKKVHVICHDYTPLTDSYVKEGLVDAIICQDPVKHGYMATKILSELVMDNREPKNQIYLTDIDIRLKENLNAQKQDWTIY
jgi:LacI family transcriptional regulator